MSTLKEAIAAFQREIGTTLHSVATQPAGQIWSVERVSLQLEVALVETPTPDGTGPAPLAVLVIPTGSSNPADSQTFLNEGARHRLTIEFSLQPRMGAGAAPMSPGELADSGRSRAGQTSTTVASAVSREDSTRLLLTELLGPPGFYSSARAAVLCDVLRDRTPEQARAVAAALNRPAKEVEDEPVRQARHLIRGLVQTGPLKSAERAEHLLLELIQGWDIPDLLPFIASQWRSEEHW